MGVEQEVALAGSASPSIPIPEIPATQVMDFDDEPEQSPAPEAPEENAAESKLEEKAAVLDGDVIESEYFEENMEVEAPVEPEEELAAPKIEAPAEPKMEIPAAPVTKSVGKKKRTKKRVTRKKK